MLPRLSITSKLSLLLLIFVLIFYGTLVHVFFHIQKMMSISEEIVSINNVINNQSKLMIENLLEMDANAKKYTLLRKEIYKEYFEKAQELFETALTTVSHLEARGYTAPAVFSLLLEEYKNRTSSIQPEENTSSPEIVWIDETTLNTWLALLVRFRDLNQDNIEQSLVQIHDMTLESTRNGLIGFGLSIIVSVFCVWLISKAILRPLKQLSHGLRTMTHGEYTNEIQITASDEFQEIAIAYNEMNAELREQENLRSDFIASLSHEIRTPLSSIQESVNMLAEEILGEINAKQHKFLTIASSELSRITELLNQLMDVSILESQQNRGKKPQLIDPVLIMTSCLDSLRATAEQKHITITQRSQALQAKIQGQPEELMQVMINILGNAIKFSPANSEISISVLKPDNSGYVLFEIADQGPGVSETEKSLIFNKYYRSRSVRKHMNGVGLGLYISKKIVQQMGGALQVNNNPLKGCTFSVMLPAA